MGLALNPRIGNIDAGEAKPRARSEWRRGEHTVSRIDLRLRNDHRFRPISAHVERDHARRQIHPLNCCLLDWRRFLCQPVKRPPQQQKRNDQRQDNDGKPEPESC